MAIDQLDVSHEPERRTASQYGSILQYSELLAHFIRLLPTA